MGSDDIAKRIARGELQTLARKILDRSEGVPHAECIECHDPDMVRAVGVLLLGMDEILHERMSFGGMLASSLPVAVVLGGVFAGIAFGVAHALGWGR